MIHFCGISTESPGQCSVTVFFLPRTPCYNLEPAMPIKRSSTPAYLVTYVNYFLQQLDLIVCFRVTPQNGLENGVLAFEHLPHDTSGDGDNGELAERG